MTVLFARCSSRKHSCLVEKQLSIRKNINPTTFFRTEAQNYLTNAKKSTGRRKSKRRKTWMKSNDGETVRAISPSPAPFHPAPVTLYTMVLSEDNMSLLKSSIPPDLRSYVRMLICNLLHYISGKGQLTLLSCSDQPCDVLMMFDCPVKVKQPVLCCCVFCCAGTWQSGWPTVTPLPMFGRWTSNALATCRAAEPSCGTEWWKSCVGSNVS